MLWNYSELASQQLKRGLFPVEFDVIWAHIFQERHTPGYSETAHNCMDCGCDLAQLSINTKHTGSYAMEQKPIVVVVVF